MTALLPESAPLSRSLARGLDRFNAKVAMARREGRRVEPPALFAHLAVAVAPVAAAIEEVDPKRVDAVVESLLDLSLDLVPREILGPKARHPIVGRVWRDLLPRLAGRLADEPRKVAAALTNAAHNLVAERARAEEWLAAMGEVGPHCSTVADLLACGQVLAWRSGLAHYRAPALEVWRSLPDRLAFEVLGVSRDAAASRAALEAALADPWRKPGDAEAGAPALRIVGKIGGFRGFGGPFLTPPRVFAFHGRVFAADGEHVFGLHADCFGQTLRRAPELPSDDRQMGPAMVEADGALSFAGLAGKLPGLAGAAGFAASETVLAVTFARSHRIALVARTGGAA